MSLARDIKDFALDLGYARVGIGPADDFDEHLREVRARGAQYDWYLDESKPFMAGAQPRKRFPAARSIVTLVWDYAQAAFPGTLVGKVGRIYQARCYNAPLHRLHGARRQLVAGFLERAGATLGQGLVVPERRAAARAGVASFGNNNFAYAKGIGSFVMLHSFVLDRELDFDPPSPDPACPRDCTRCMDACPTGAIYAPLKLDPRRCLAFNHWVTLEGRPKVSAVIPPELRAAMGSRVHGCDACQEACPRNAAKLAARLPEDPFLVQLAESFSLPALLESSDGFFARTVQPIMYNYISEKKYFQRNAAIALGNGGDPEHVPALDRALADPEPLVRGHAAWALGRIGGRRARTALEARLAGEAAPFVRAELQDALETGR